LELREFPLPELRAGEVLVELTCSTICGSDLHTIRGARPVAGPTVLGHETIGRIVQLAEGESPPTDVLGNELTVGDRVTWSVAASCGRCFYCQRALPQKCESLFKYGHETTARQALSGGLAEYCQLLPGTAIVKVPEILSDYAACPANCATATVACAMRIAGDCAGKSVLIHGAGMLGLTAAAMASTQGAAAIIVSDLSEQRLARADTFGATHSVCVRDDGTALPNLVQEVSGGRGVDVVFEMSGATVAVEQSIGLLRIGGQLVLVGSVFPGPGAQLSPEQIVRKLLRIDGVHNYAPQDLATAVDFLSVTAASQPFPFESLVSPPIPLEELDAYLKRNGEPEYIRLAVCAR